MTPGRRASRPPPSRPHPTASGSTSGSAFRNSEKSGNTSRHSCDRRSVTHDRTMDLSMGFLSDSNPLAVAGIAVLAILLVGLALWYFRTDPSVRVLLGSLATKDS